MVFTKTVKTFTCGNGSKLSFEKSGLIKLNNHCIGEFNIKDINLIRSIIGSFKVFNNEIKGKNYKITFDEDKRKWYLWKTINCFGKEIATKKCGGHIVFSKFNQIERDLFFNH